MSDGDAKDRRLNTIESTRQEAAGLLAGSGPDSIKSYIHRAVRHLIEADLWLNDTSIAETARLQHTDAEISAAVSLLAHVTKALSTQAPDSKEIG